MSAVVIWKNAHYVKMDPQRRRGKLGMYICPSRLQDFFWRSHLFWDEAGIWDGREGVGDGDEGEQVVRRQRVRQLPVPNS